MPRSLLLVLLIATQGLAVEIDAPSAAIRTGGGPGPRGSWNLWSNGRVGQPLRFREGRYTVIVRAWGSPAGGVWPRMAVLLDEEPLTTVDVALADEREHSVDVVVPAGVHEIAAAFLNDALLGREDRNLFVRSIAVRPREGAPEPAIADLEALAESIREREREALARADQDIERLRKADALVRVVDEAGAPIAGAAVRVEQTGHEFLFGCNLLRFGRFRDRQEETQYRKRFAELFNYATLGFYWSWYERERGKPEYAYTDTIVSWCGERGIRMKGHPLLWGQPAGIPPWSRGQPPADVQRRRVEEILGRYRGKIELWEVVNEPSHVAEPRIDEPYRWARAADPEGRLIVNDYFVLGDGAPAFYALLEKAATDGVPFDGVGIQAHEPRSTRFRLDRVKAVLDRYSKLGKELHITEFSPPSAGQKMGGVCLERTWDEEAQAEYAVEFYRVCFAHPALQAVTWWDLCDEGAWLEGGGLLRSDLSVKPAYDRLKKLIRGEWTTRANGETDAKGAFAFRGFRGRYAVVVEKGERRASRDIGLLGGQPAELVVTLPER